MRLMLGAAFAATLVLTGCSSEPEPQVDLPSSTAHTAEPSPEDSYIGALDESGHFPANVTGAARGAWIRTGRKACTMLEVNGDVAGTRSEIAQSLADFNGQGMAEPGLAERAVAVVDAASRYLCPDVAVS